MIATADAQRRLAFVDDAAATTARRDFLSLGKSNLHQTEARMRCVVRRWLCACVLATLVSPLASTAQVPGKTSLTIIVPFAPGGTSDALARALAEPIRGAMNQPVIVDNRAGASTTIGTQAAFAAPANGQTLVMNTASSVINPYLMPRLGYDIHKDFVPVTLLASNPHILVVHPNVPVQDLNGFIAWARAKNGTASYASFGNGSSGHLGFDLFRKAAHLNMLHVPYKGVAPATTDLLGGQVDAMLTDLAQVTPLIRAGKLKAIAVASEARSPLLADVPTFTEAGLPGFTSKSWFGLLVRAGTPPDAVARLNAVFVSALRQPTIRVKLAEAGMDPIGSSSTEFAAFMAAESQRYAEAVKFSGAKLD
ncbi:Bug family tripartite tricarboxylate transporter substrate binding protein [Variovorax sp. RT4R15]|uniref:Bug family tripartite tricarboxylate transporter substrate binding protein n=1 Tax=Variovorax sp. RT4R15 TaxID=3443737 RepID=UPI003F48BAED